MRLILLPAIYIRNLGAYDRTTNVTAIVSVRSVRLVPLCFLPPATTLIITMALSHVSRMLIFCISWIVFVLFLRSYHPLV